MRAIRPGVIGDNLVTLATSCNPDDLKKAVSLYKLVALSIANGDFDDLSDPDFAALLDDVEFAEACLLDDSLGDKQSRRERLAARKKYRATKRQLRRDRRAGKITRSERRRLKREAKALKKSRYKEAKVGRKDRKDRKKAGISSTIEEVGIDAFEDIVDFIESPAPFYRNPLVIGAGLLVVGVGVAVVVWPKKKKKSKKRS